LGSNAAVNRVSVNVTTYNVLGIHLGGADYYTHCNPLDLDPNTRLERVKTKLEESIKSESIICLQEVSMPWAGSLHSYFSQRGYYFVTGLYGSKFNGYMGVGLAVPTNRYTIEETDITRVADTKRYPRRPKSHAVIEWLKMWIWNPLSTRLFRPFLGWLRMNKLLPSPPEDPWSLSYSRFNQLVSMRLSVKPPATAAGAEAGGAASSSAAPVPAPTPSFVVSTYHMPCIFKIPSVMTIHSALAAQHVQRFAKSDPYLFLGDFNIKPADAMYRMLTQGKLDSKVAQPHVLYCT
jgi:2',5'-phosphodiesterase